MKSLGEQLRVKELYLGDIRIGDPVVESAVKLLVEPSDGKITTRRVLYFKGATVHNLNLTDISRRMTIKREGTIKEASKGGNKKLIEETVDVGGQLLGGVSVVQFKRIAQIMLGKMGVIKHDGRLVMTADLKSGDRVIGQAKYEAIKFEKVRDVGTALKGFLDVPSYKHQSQMSGEPALLTRADVDMNLDSLPKDKDGFVYVKLEERFPLDSLGIERLAQDVLITADYKISSEQAHEIAGALRLNLGQFTFSEMYGHADDERKITRIVPAKNLKATSSGEEV